MNEFCLADTPATHAVQSFFFSFVQELMSAMLQSYPSRKAWDSSRSPLWLRLGRAVIVPETDSVVISAGSCVEAGDGCLALMRRTEEK
jgi:hypothetical protein